MGSKLATVCAPFHAGELVPLATSTEVVEVLTAADAGDSEDAGRKQRRNLSTERRPDLAFSKGSESVKGVGPTPVLHTNSPKGTSVLSLRMRRSGRTCRMKDRVAKC